MSTMGSGRTAPNGLSYLLLVKNLVNDEYTDSYPPPLNLKDKRRHSASRQAREIRAFVDPGGSVLTTFETGLYDESGKPRSDFALASLFGMLRVGGRIGYGGKPKFGGPVAGSTFMQRIEQPDYPILSGFGDTDVIKGGSCYVPTTAGGKPLLTLIPQYPIYPAEAVFPKVGGTDTPC